ncbi:unnamed protein product, partial [Linum tenue]
LSTAASQLPSPNHRRYYTLSRRSLPAIPSGDYSLCCIHLPPCIASALLKPLTPFPPALCGCCFLSFSPLRLSSVFAIWQNLELGDMSAATFNSVSCSRGCWWKGDGKIWKTNKPNGDYRLNVKRHSVVSPKGLSISCSKLDKEVRVALLGASGYTGAEIIRLLANHPSFGIGLMTADRNAGKSIESVFPHLVTQKDLPTLISTSDADFSDVDAVFCCLPHGTTQEIIKGLPHGLKIVDLSADFRLQDISEYEQWYGQAHKAPDLQEEAVYGLTEMFREQIKAARLVANPGCYPTSIQLPLVPLIKAKLIRDQNIIIDAKSGVSGAGRGAKVSNLYTELSEGIMSYGVTKHRHVPEIEQGLSEASGVKVTVSFTPHLMPMSRGMQSTIYVEMAPGATVDELYEQLKLSYEKEEFVRVLEKGVVPRTHDVRGSNYCYMNVFPDRIPNRAIIISVIDNLVKGASGQAIQNLNIMMGLPENTGLASYLPVFP